MAGSSAGKRLRYEAIYQSRKVTKPKGNLRSQAEGSSAVKPMPPPAKQ